MQNNQWNIVRDQNLMENPNEYKITILIMIFWEFLWPFYSVSHFTKYDGPLGKLSPLNWQYELDPFYRFGVLFNMARLTVDDVRVSFAKGPWWLRLFNGYDLMTWLVVLNLGCTGLLVSWVMKYADNIVKVQFHSLLNVMLRATLYTRTWGPTTIQI